MSGTSRAVHVVIGLGFGDEGKGATTDYLVRETGAKAVMRYNGGPQAAHHVTAPDGRSHVFAQFGAGTFVEGVRTIISRHMCVDPPAFLREEQVLRESNIHDAMARTFPDAECIIVTPYHAGLNRMLEISRDTGRHGSCGRGVGQALLDTRVKGVPVLRLKDCLNPSSVLREVRNYKLKPARQIAHEYTGGTETAQRLQHELRDMEDIDEDALWDLYAEFTGRVNVHSPANTSGILPGGDIVLEGAQGVLLDRDYGFFPHVTAASCIAGDIQDLLGEYGLGPEAKVTRYGVLRAYGVRHGAGPFPCEDATVNFPPDAYNGHDPWQGSLRTGWFDAVLARLALRLAAPIHEIVLTNLDRLRGQEAIRACFAYEYPGDAPDPGAFLRYERSGNRLIIRDVLPQPADDLESRRELTRLLNLCRPLYREFVHGVDATSLDKATLTPGEQDFLNWLQSSEGMGRGVSIISLGPTANDRQRI